MARQDGTRQISDETKMERDLGVMVSDNLKVKAQVETAEKIANQTLGRLKKACRIRGMTLWRTLYTTFVRPKLEFAVQAWSSHLKQDNLTLEKVQKRATKTIAAIKHLPYAQRPQCLGLMTLEDRRIRGDLIQQYKMDQIEFHVV
jgi:ribonuclease P/MRP protein subunit RPP40